MEINGLKDDLQCQDQWQFIRLYDNGQSLYTMTL